MQSETKTVTGQNPEDLPYPKNLNGFWKGGTWGEAIVNAIEGQARGGMDTTIRGNGDGELWLYQFEGSRRDVRKIRQDLTSFTEEAMAKAGIEPLPIDEIDARMAMRYRATQRKESEEHFGNEPEF